MVAEHTVVIRISGEEEAEERPACLRECAGSGAARHRQQRKEEPTHKIPKHGARLLEGEET